MPRKPFPIPKGTQRVSFSTRSLPDAHLERMRILALQRGAISGGYYPLERIANDCIATGLDILEPKIAMEFREYRANRKRRLRKAS